MSQYSRLLQQIASHLFIISPNNSGSTFLKNAISACRRTWSLEKEGQNTFGFVGAGRWNGSMRISPLLWAENQRSVDHIQNPDIYDWERSKKAWYMQARSPEPDVADIFVEKSPPFLLIVDKLEVEFSNTKFLFMVRNPYAVVESISRRVSLLKYCANQGADLTELAARHIINCFRYQRSNIEKYGHNNNVIFFRYEDMCDNYVEIEHKIKNWMPGLQDLELNQKIPVKGIYNEYLCNMNNQQIRRLSVKQLDTISEIFEPEKGLLQYFGYDLIEKVNFDTEYGSENPV